MPQGKPQSRSQVKKERVKEEKQLTVSIPNPLLYSVFGGPFRLTNLHMTDSEIEEEVERDGDGDGDGGGDRDRPLPMIHANLARAIEFMLRARGSDGNNMMVKSQGDADRIHDIAQSLQKDWDGDVVVLAKGDHRWLLQKSEEHAHKIFPTDSTTVIQHIKDAVDVMPSGE